MWRPAGKNTELCRRWSRSTFPKMSVFFRTLWSEDFSTVVQHSDVQAAKEGSLNFIILQCNHCSESLGRWQRTNIIAKKLGAVFSHMDYLALGPSLFCFFTGGKRISCVICMFMWNTSLIYLVCEIVSRRWLKQLAFPLQLLLNVYNCSSKLPTPSVYLIRVHLVTDNGKHTLAVYCLSALTAPAWHSLVLTWPKCLQAKSNVHAEEHRHNYITIKINSRKIWTLLSVIYRSYKIQYQLTFAYFVIMMCHESHSYWYR